MDGFVYSWDVMLRKGRKSIPMSNPPLSSPWWNGCLYTMPFALFCGEMLFDRFGAVGGG